MRTTLIAVVALYLGALAQAQSTPMVGPKIWNDTYTDLIARNEPFLPNPFLTKTVEGKKPGKALDIAMGQGRNALMLAEHGWEVTGFDISDIAITLTKAQAEKRGLKVNAVIADADTFDYGVEQYDLVAAIYVHGLLTDRVDDVIRSLKHGGLLVVEGVHHDSRPMYGYETNELLRVIFGRSLTVLYYEDGVGQPDGTWKISDKDVRFVRLVARKD
jgi:SAM-dependent methyltransferase